MRIAFPVALSALPLILVCTPACVTDHVVVVGGTGFVYTPNSLTIQIGDTVTFTNDPVDGGGGFHNVHATGGPTLFQCSVTCSAGSNTPNGSAWKQTISFPTAGTVNFQCDQHAGFGMSGTITVQGTVPVRLQSFEVD